MWEQIRANRRKSLWLVSGMAVVLAALGYAMGELIGGPGRGPLGVPPALCVLLVQWLVYLAAGESLLLEGSNAKELKREDSPRLFNIVEEMQLASGLGYMPRIYLIDDPSPNAFAVGRKPESSAIAVTTGLLYRLNRDELQGVIAHEMSHLANGDSHFMTLAGVMLGSIVMLTEFMWRWMRWGPRIGSRSSSRDSGGGQAQLIIFIVAMVVAALAPLMAQILYFATSRKREYLADACAAQYTRYPAGLASALAKIRDAEVGVSFASKATAPMFIVNPLYAGKDEPDNMFSTHPATENRIKVLRAMSGASLADYEAAYERAQQSKLIGSGALKAAPGAVAIRAASNEGPIESREEAKATVHRLYGFIEVDCQCGMKMRVPDSYGEDSINCIRCGTRIALPAARERYAGYLETKAAPDSGASLPPLQFTRTGKGWQSFRCACGGTVQISPGFSAPHASCPKCGRTIEIQGG